MIAEGWKSTSFHDHLELLGVIVLKLKTLKVEMEGCLEELGYGA